MFLIEAIAAFAVLVFIAIAMLAEYLHGEEKC